jgi:hypothetical protein
MKPLTVEVITYAPTVFSHCQHCEVAFQEMGIGERLRRVEAAAALPEDLAREFQAWSDWIHRLLERYGSRVRIKVVDAASIEGVVESVRHRVGRYPAVILDGREKRFGADFEALDRAISARLAAQVSPASPG